MPKAAGDTRPPGEIPEDERDYYLETKHPSFGVLVPRDVASRSAKLVCDAGRGVGPTGYGMYLDFREVIGRLGEAVSESKHSNLSHMYRKITAENPYELPMRIYPAVHYTMGGLWVDYNLMTTVPGLYAIGEADFSNLGANQPPRRQRAHAGAGGPLRQRQLRMAKMQLTLRVWRQVLADSPALFRTCQTRYVSPDMSFLEMLGEVNVGLIASGDYPIAFDHDRREGDCRR